MKIKLIPETEITLIDEEGKEYSFKVKGLTRKQWNMYQDKVMSAVAENKTEEELERVLGEFLLKQAIEDEKAVEMILNGSIAAYKQVIEIIKNLSILGEEEKKKSELSQE